MLQARMAHSNEIPNPVSQVRIPRCTRVHAMPQMMQDVPINRFLKVTKKIYHVKAISLGPRSTSALTQDMHVLV